MAKNGTAQKKIEKAVKKTHSATVVLTILFLVAGIAAEFLHPRI